MREIEFRNWLQKTNCKAKVISDHVSRLHRLEREIGYALNHSVDIDSEYEKDKCKYLFSIFYNSGRNPIADQLRPINLPLGSYSFNTIRYSLRKYIEFIECNQ